MGTTSDAAASARFYTSLAAALLLNPRVALWSVAQSVGQSALALHDLVLGPPALPVVTARPPFEDAWRVYRGGTTPETSHSWTLIGQRFAYDFVRDAADGSEPRGDRLTDYPAFGTPILAAASGTVIAVRDDCRDHPRPGRGWIDWRAADPRGNFVLIRHDAGWISLSAHLRAGSIPVRPGQRVRPGEVVGACGNSGHSTEPHLHFQAQDRPSFFFARSLPILFEEALLVPDADGSVEDGPTDTFLHTGQRVAAGAAARIPAAGTAEAIVAPTGATELMVGLLSLASVLLGLSAMIRLAVAVVTAIA
jgi:hypothetical protein